MSTPFHFPYHDISDCNAIVWCININHHLPYCEPLSQCLIFDEYKAVKQFHFSADQACHLITRASLRLLLGQYLDLPPTEIVFEKTAHGKPYVKDSPIHFNISHTREWLIIAFAKTPVGIDIEKKERLSDQISIAKRFFHPEEYRALTRLPQHQQSAGFIKTWVTKEAWVKASGEGIADQLTQFVVDVNPDKAPSILQTNHPAQRHCFSIKVDCGFYCVLVTEQCVCDIVSCDIKLKKS